MTMQEDMMNTLPGGNDWMTGNAGDGDEGSCSAGITSGGDEQLPEGASALEKPAISDLQAVASAFTAAFNTALYELETSRKQLEERAGRISELDDSIMSIRAALDTEVGKGREREAEYTRTTGQLNQQLVELGSERDHLQEKVREQEAISIAQADELSRLSARIEEQNAILEQRAAEAQFARQESEQEIDRLAGELKALQEQYDSTDDELKALQSVLEERNNEIADLRSLHDRQTGELQSKIGEISGLEQEISELTAQVETQSEAIRRESEHHASACEAMNSRLMDANRELEVLRAAHDELAAHAEKLETLNSALHESQISKNAVHKQQMNEKSDEIRLLRSRLEAANEAAITESDRTISDLEEKLKAAEAEIETLDSKVGLAGELEAENERLRAALQASADLASPGEEDAQRLQEQLADLQSRLDSSLAEQKLFAAQMHDYEALRQEVTRLREGGRLAEDRQDEHDIGGGMPEALRDEALGPGIALAAPELNHAVPNTASSGAAGLDLSGSPVAAGQDGEPAESAGDRARFIACLDNLLAESRDSGSSHNLMYVLLDNFAQVRHEIGVMESESVISEVAEIIASFCGGEDTMSRFGDCTFALICGGESLNQTEEKAEQIRLAVEGRIFETGGRSVVMTASIGICSIRKGDVDAGDVISRADLACEAARTYGGNQVLVSSAMADKVISTGTNDSHAAMIRAILDDGRARLYYQPITSLREQLDDHYEILIRIIDESGNIILPGEFMSMAERCGYAARVDRYVIENVMKMMAENRAQRMTLFIKLTGQSVADQDLPVWMMHKIKEYRINPEQLVFEVAENLLQSNIKNLSMLSRALNTVGCKIAIEHYRMSSQPQHLMHIHAHYLKIDNGLIEGISRKGACLLKIASIMKLAKQNHYITIAEGVESSTALALLCELGVEMAQGYFIQAPAGNRDFDFQSSVPVGEQEESQKAIFRIG